LDVKSSRLIEVVSYCEQYRDAVVDVILPIQQSEFGIPITLAAQPDLLDISGFYQKKDGNFWVALHGPDVVGTVALLDIGNGQGALRKMFVKTAYRGREPGVAHRLLDVLLQWCARRELLELYLGTTTKFLAAHRFYEKHGFFEIHKSQLPGAFPIMSVDTKFYKLVLGGSAVGPGGRADAPQAARR
jgi:N-acetylglutamate synthase-like GNAT family acetyltransferase